MPVNGSLDPGDKVEAEPWYFIDSLIGFLHRKYLHSSGVIASSWGPTAHEYTEPWSGALLVKSPHTVQSDGGTTSVERTQAFLPPCPLLFQLAIQEAGSVVGKILLIIHKGQS